MSPARAASLIRLRAGRDALVRLQADIRAIRGRTDPERARDLVGCRRALSNQVAEITAAARALLAEPAFSAEQGAFTQIHSRLLSNIARHQAEWPAVRLAHADEDYRRSAEQADRAIDAMVAWLTAMVDRR